MIENWKEKIVKNKFVSLSSIDLSKAFDTIDHKLFIVQLEAYGLSYSSLKYLKTWNCNTNRNNMYENPSLCVQLSLHVMCC